MDLDAVRTFVAAADAGQFQEAAVTLTVTQQAVSKRIAALEKDLSVRLFTRTSRGAELTIDGQAFLPYARELLRAEARADASVRPGRRALRVDVINRRIAAAVLLQDFYRAHPEVELDVMTLNGDITAAVAAVSAGTIDATFHAVPNPSQQLPETVLATPVIAEPHELLVGPGHPFADAGSITPYQLHDQRIWMPGMAPGTEWSDYYLAFAAAFSLTIDVIGPVFGNEALLAEIADSPSLTTLIGENSRYLWPDSYALRRIPIRNPTPIYPMSLIWRRDNPHPALTKLRRHLTSQYTPAPVNETWQAWPSPTAP